MLIINARRHWGSSLRMKTITVVMTAIILAAGGAVEAESVSLSELQERINKTKDKIGFLDTAIGGLKVELGTLQTEFKNKESAVAEAEKAVAEAEDDLQSVENQVRLEGLRSPDTRIFTDFESNSENGEQAPVEAAESKLKAAKSNLEAAKRQVEAARERLEEAELKRDAKRGNLLETNQTLEIDKNERDFRDLSFNTGLAVLRESGPDGSNETETMISMHRLLKTWSDETLGWGPFVAINVEGDVAEFIGVGALFSFRRENGAHPLSVGAGYIIDRFGFMDDDGARLGDRSGLFFVVSINPSMSGVDIFKKKFSLPD